MKQSSKGIFFLWALIAMVVGGGVFLLAEHFNVGVTTAGGDGAAPAVDANVATDDVATSSPAFAGVPTQDFSNADAGYAFSVPKSWDIEKTASDTVSVHPDTASSGGVACKIEVSVFPYSAGADGMADWIAHRLGADPSVAVVEQSSEDVSLANGGTGVEWIGTMDGVPTTLVYAFNAAHAYEIAPSVVGAGASAGTGTGADDVAQCGDALQSFLSTLKI